MKKRNAVIMVAGMATRFVPLSLEKPKALLEINGEVLVERQIRQLREAGIDEIVIVVGYLKEQFYYLKEKYGVIMIENPYYQERNNHSSIYMAREYLGNTFICSGDNYFHYNVFKEESDVPYYASVYANGETDEWCFITDDKNRIQSVTVGGQDAWTMKGHAYYTEEFSAFIKPYIEKSIDCEADRDKFWEDIFLEHADEMAMYIRKYEENTLEEFDSLEELREFDKHYVNQTGSELVEKLCILLDCKEADLNRFSPNKANGQVVGFNFLLHDKQYQYELGKGLI